MDILKDSTCRLCLNNTRDQNVEIIGKSTTDAFDLLRLNMRWTVTEAPIICNSCSDCLAKALHFKKMCLGTEATITNFTGGGGEKNLSAIYEHIKGNTGTIANFVDKKICRLCLSLIENGFKSFGDDLVFDMMQEYIPEVNLSILSDPVLCLICLDAFRGYVTFTSSCSNIEEEITKYIDNAGADENGYIKLEDVARFSQNNLDSVTGNNIECTGIKKEVMLMKVKTEKLEDDFQKSEYSGTESKVSDICASVDQKVSRPTNFLPETVIKQEKCDAFDEVSVKSNEQFFACDGDLESNSENTGAVLKQEVLDSDSFQSPTTLKYENATAYRTSQDLCLEEYNLSAQMSLDNRNYNVAWQTESTPNDSGEEKYKCTTCVYKTKYKAFLERHLQRHTDRSATLNCDECEFTTNCKRSLEKHLIKQHHPSESPMYECDKCDYFTSQRYRLRDHGLVHKDPSEVQLFNCDECEFKTKWRNTLKKHKLTHKEPLELQMHPCEICQFSTKSKRYLSQHLLIHRQGVDYKCKTCGYETKYKSYLERHESTHNSEGEIFRCTECDYETFTKYSLDKHSMKHKKPADSPLYKCEVCDYGSNRKYRLKEHSLSHKEPWEVQTYKCDECGFETKWRNTYNKHVLSHKEETRPHVYKCSVCEYTTKFRSHLNQHSIVHKDPSKMEMHKCKLCGFETKTKHNLRSHMLSHVDVSKVEKSGSEVNGQVVQIFECDSCDYRAKRKAQLARHVLSHRTDLKFSCDLCDFRTKYKDRLAMHSLTHKTPSELKMYNCETCDYKTKWPHNLKVHKLKHKSPSEVEMFKCEFCGRSSKYRQDIKAHTRKCMFRK